jgi:hypothetical protein
MPPPDLSTPSTHRSTVEEDFRKGALEYMAEESSVTASLREPARALHRSIGKSARTRQALAEMRAALGAPGFRSRATEKHGAIALRLLLEAVGVACDRKTTVALAQVRAARAEFE